MTRPVPVDAAALRDRDVLVIGLGASGFAAARAMMDLGAVVRVTERDEDDAIRRRATTLTSAGARVETGGHDLGTLEADLAVVSPGIPPWSDVLVALKKTTTPAISEVELAFLLARCDFLAVTGTNGKTTTTSLLAAMLEEGGIPSLAAGNIGLPLVDAVLSVPEGGAIAVEVSSFQLALIHRFRATVAVLLNLAEDHTDWHGSFGAYVGAKARALENQIATDTFVYNHDDDVVRALAGRAPGRALPFSVVTELRDGVCVSGGRILYLGAPVIDVDEVPLLGAAGLQDVMGAMGAALAYGVDPRAAARATKAFRPLAHRLEMVAEAGGVSYIDDSKATNPHATLAALDGLRDVVLIAGGRSKGIDLSGLARAVPPVVAVIAIGEAGEQIEKVFEGLVPVARADSMDDAVALARGRAAPGGSVLLSPGCASLDMYESYAARGEDFARAVRAAIETG